MPFARENGVSVRQKRKGSFLEAIEFFVHGSLSYTIRPMNAATPFNFTRSALRLYLVVKRLLFCTTLHATARDLTRALHLRFGITCP